MMNNKIQPYREAAIVPEKPKKPMFGLILKPKSPKPPKPPKPHVCKKPISGFLFGPKLTLGSVWRCQECKTVYKIESIHSDWCDSTTLVWNLSNFEEWIKAGGSI